MLIKKSERIIYLKKKHYSLCQNSIMQKDGWRRKWRSEYIEIMRKGSLQRLRRGLITNIYQKNNHNYELQQNKKSKT